MLHVLNSTTRPTKYPFQFRLALNQRPPPDIITCEKKIESAGYGIPIACAAVQGVEIRNPSGRYTGCFLK